MDTIEIEPEIGIPFRAEEPYLDLRERAEAVCATAVELNEAGLTFDDADTVDQVTAETLAKSYAQNPEKTSNAANTTRVANMTPQSLILAGGILKEFGQSVLQNSLQIRHLVTNKLILETENADPRVRMKALELLGKISDVGLFSEKSEVTITHQSSDELKSKLRGKLEKLINPDTEPKEVPVLIEAKSVPDHVVPEPSASISDINVDEMMR